VAIAMTFPSHRFVIRVLIKNGG